MLYNHPTEELIRLQEIKKKKSNQMKKKYISTMDILSKRCENYLTTYFLKFDKSERDKINAFVSDMWKPYASLASNLFKNSD